MKTMTALTSLLIATSCASYAQSNAATRPTPMAFSDYDSDRSGAISEQEFYQARARRMAERAEQGYPLRNAHGAPSFADFDANNDDELSPDELIQGQKEQRSRDAGNADGAPRPSPITPPN